MNRWNIPEWLERDVIERDRSCVYCGVRFAAQSTSRRDRPSWEHIINDARLVTPGNIARFCIGCNARRDGDPGRGGYVGGRPDMAPHTPPTLLARTTV